MSTIIAGGSDSPDIPVISEETKKIYRAGINREIEKGETIKKVIITISLIAVPLITVLDVLLSGAVSSGWFSISSFCILPKMQACKAFYKIIVVALPIILTSGLVPSILTFLALRFIIKINLCQDIKNSKKKVNSSNKEIERLRNENNYKSVKNFLTKLILANLTLAVSTFSIILINTLIFSISSYKPMNLKRCLITIAIVNGLVALTSFLAAASISIMICSVFTSYIKNNRRLIDKLETARS